jgi:hypothetical protein
VWRVYASCPKPREGKSNVEAVANADNYERPLPPSDGLQSFGTVRVAATTQKLTVELRNLEGQVIRSDGKLARFALRPAEPGAELTARAILAVFVSLAEGGGGTHLHQKLVRLLIKRTSIPNQTRHRN